MFRLSATCPTHAIVPGFIKSAMFYENLKLCSPIRAMKIFLYSRLIMGQTSQPCGSLINILFVLAFPVY